MLVVLQVSSVEAVLLVMPAVGKAFTVTVTLDVVAQMPLPVTVTVYMVVPDIPFAIGLAILVAAKVLPAGLSDHA